MSCQLNGCQSDTSGCSGYQNLLSFDHMCPGQQVQRAMLGLLLLWPLGLGAGVGMAALCARAAERRWIPLLGLVAVVLMLLRLGLSGVHRYALELCP